MVNRRKRNCYVEEDGKKPETTVTVHETEVPEEELPEKSEVIIEELPEEIVKDGKQEKTEIVTVEEDGKKPETTVTVHETEVPEEESPEKPTWKIEELPEEVQITDIGTDDKPKKRITKKQVITKHKEGKQEKTEIVTMEGEGEKSETKVTVLELEVPEEELLEKLEEQLAGKPIFTIEELPEEVQVTEEITDGKSKRRIIKKRVIKKQKEGKEIKTEIITVEEEGKMPETTVTVHEIEVPKEELPEKSMFEIEELPVEAQVTEVNPKKRTTKKFVKKEEKDVKQEIFEVMPVADEERVAESSSTVQEFIKPDEEAILFIPTLAENQNITDEDVLSLLKIEMIKKVLAHPLPELPREMNIPLGKCVVVFELPEKTDTILSSDGNKQKVTIRTLKKRKGDKDEILQIITYEKEGEKPVRQLLSDETRIISTESPIAALIELPEDLDVIEISTTGKTPVKKITKKRTFLKKNGDKLEATEITTIIEDNKKPLEIVNVYEYTDKLEDKPDIKKPKRRRQEIAEVVEIKPIHAKFDDLTQVKLRKPRPQKPKQEEGKLTKIRLKSRIRFIPFPVDSEKEKKIIISVLPAYRKEQGILSRNIQEAKKIPKKKYKKFVDIEIDFPDLEKQEKIDNLTQEQKISDLEGIKYEKESKIPVERTEQPSVIKKGKGKLSEENPEDEKIKLKGIPKTNSGEVKKTIGKQPDVGHGNLGKPKQKSPEDSETLRFEPYDVDRTYTDLETPDKSEEQPKDKTATAARGKYTRKTKKIPHIDKEQQELKPGTPKDIAQPEDSEITRKIKQKDLPEEFPDVINLKPFKRRPQQEKLFKVEEFKGMPTLISAVVFELPEEISEIQDVTSEGIPVKKTVKKRVIRKKMGPTIEITTIETISSDDSVPEIIVKTENVDEAYEIPLKVVDIIELPETTEEVEYSARGKKKVKKINKKVFKKPVDAGYEVTEILTVSEEGKEPLTSVSVYIAEDVFSSEIDLHTLSMETSSNVTSVTPTITTQNVTKTITEVYTLEKTEDTESVQPEVARAKGTLVHDINESILIEEVQTQKPIGKVPKQEPVSAKDTPSYIEELPEDVQIIETLEEGVPKKTTLRKRVIKKRKGSRQESTEITTIEKEGEEPQSTVVFRR
ncbi:hypothetical protein JTB14_030233 [Gonioctena quinquepunctata]|nr:hypothetical protein JTB14_030233 [Gonioctena quinquepunctata]